MTTEKGTILAVDDSPESLALLTRILTQAGFQVRPADSGELALASLAGNPVDLILLDVRMKGLDGLELCRRLKANEDTQRIPVILISAFADVKDWVQGLKLGAADYITKPFQAEELLTRVQTHLALGNARVALLEREAALRLANYELRAEIAVRQAAEKARAELRSAEERVRTTLRSIGDAVIATDATGRIELQNPMAEALTGWSTDEARGRRLEEVFRIVNEDTRQSVESPAALALREGRVFELPAHTLLVARDGTERPISDSGAPIRNAEGDLTGAVLVFRDQTEERANERGLRLERDNLRSFLSAIPAAVMVVDETRAVLHANQGAERLLGLGPAGRSGRGLPCVHLEHADPNPCRGAACEGGALHEVLRENAAGREVRGRELRARSWVGGASQLRDLVVSAEPATLTGRRSTVLVISDVTELRQAQREREALQAGLAQADRLATMGLLAAGVAHEINNPLAYVLYNLDSLSQELPALVESVRRWHGQARLALAPGASPEPLDLAAFDDPLARLREALEGSERIKSISRSLSTFSRVERSEVAPVDVQTSLEHALTMASNELKFRARVVRDFRPVSAVLASDGKLAQVFLNLLINAAHAIKEGHVEQNEVRVRLWAEADEVCAEVSDTGRGISPEHQPKLFTPFFTTKGAGLGSGLGLSICKTIIASFGGTLGFSSEPGQPTRFWVRLPRLPAGWASPDSSVAVPAASPPSVRGRVLVVDDEPGIRVLVKRMLAAEHEVVMAGSGEEAQALLESDRRFDVVYCDLMMPRMSGMELHAWLVRQHPGFAQRVVFITGGAFTPGSSEYLATAGTRHVDKPFDPGGLRRLTSELVLAARAATVA